MEQNPQSPINGDINREIDNNGDQYMEITDIMEAAYKHPDLMSLLSENLMFCNNIGAALYAVATANEKALLRTFCH